MPSEWRSPCGVPYRTWEDGRIEVQGQGFPVFTAQAHLDQIQRIWQRWGAAMERAAAAHQIPASYLVAFTKIESGGEPKAWSGAGACGITQFMPFTARNLGQSCAYYVEHPEDQLMDTGKLLNQLMKQFGGCLLRAVKQYNGGGSCSDTSYDGNPGILNMYGQHDYVANFVRAANTFVSLNLPSQLGTQDASSGSTTSTPVAAIVVAGIAGVVAYMFADIKWGLTDRMLAAMGSSTPAFRMNCRSRRLH